MAILIIGDHERPDTTVITILNLMGSRKDPITVAVDNMHNHIGSCCTVVFPKPTGGWHFNYGQYNLMNLPLMQPHSYCIPVNGPPFRHHDPPGKYHPHMTSVLDL